MEPRLNNLNKLALSIVGTPERQDRLPVTISRRTRRIYDAVAKVYPLSTFFFHSRAHRVAMDVSGIRDGMRVLEVATGSGEMFRRLVRLNPNGETIGIDLSPNMAARTQLQAKRNFPAVRAHCGAVDARQMPYREESFDAIVCCYLFELLASDDILLTMRELRRILRRRGTLTVVTIGEYDPAFNQLYKVAGRLAPAFWGRQVEQRLPELIKSMQFRILADRTVRQGFYPSRVLTARK